MMKIVQALQSTLLYNKLIIMDFLCDVDDIFLFLIDAAGICICFMYISMAFLSRVAGGREICLFK